MSAISMLFSNFCKAYLLDYDASKYITINNGENLSDLTSYGVYCCNGTDTAKTLENCPTDQAFKMIVEALSYDTSIISQKIVVINSRNSAPYVRTRQSNNVWGPWFQLASKSDLNYSTINAENHKGITFNIKKNISFISLQIGGKTTSAINAGDLIGNLSELAKPSTFTEFLVYDIKNNVTYSMTIDANMAIRVYGNNLPEGAQLRGIVTYFAPNS